MLAVLSATAKHAAVRSVEVSLKVANGELKTDACFTLSVPESLSAEAANVKQRALLAPIFQDATDEQSVACAFYQAVLDELDDHDEGAAAASQSLSIHPFFFSFFSFFFRCNGHLSSFYASPSGFARPAVSWSLGVSRVGWRSPLLLPLLLPSLALQLVLIFSNRIFVHTCSLSAHTRIWSS